MEFVKDLSVVIGLWVIFYNIVRWHVEHRGKRNIELAEETLALFYEAKDVIAWIRNPMGFSGETDLIEKNPNEDDEEYEARKKASVVFVRYNQNKELFNKIHSLRYRFMAQIGKGKTKPFDDLDRITREIIVSARHLAALWSEKYIMDMERKRKHNEEVEKAKAVFWDTLKEADPINPRINKTISDIEKTCKDIIMAKGVLHQLLSRTFKVKNVCKYKDRWKLLWNKKSDIKTEATRTDSS